MSDPNHAEVTEVAQTVQRKTRRSGLVYLMLGALLAALVVTLFLLIRAYDDKDEALARLNQQFIYCAVPENANKPYCSEPVVGPAGQQGEAGPQGEPGEQGEQGEPGADGTDGANGQNGTNGGRGQTGQTGASGAAGAAGAPGSDGSDGSPGLDGQDGQDGAQGLTGAAGQDGQDGAQGPAGPQGEQGPAGPSGVVSVDNQCAPPEGEYVTDVDVDYDSGAQALVITCTSAPGLVP